MFIIESNFLLTFWNFLRIPSRTNSRINKIVLVFGILNTFYTYFTSKKAMNEPLKFSEPISDSL